MPRKPGRNDPCPCGSGKKYKRCCLGKDQQRAGPALPGSPRQHDLDREAIRYVEAKLPNRWPCGPPAEGDYGIDLLVRVHEGGYATGLEFRIQAKGHERFEVVHSEQIAQELRVSTLNYFDRMLLPVLLVVYSASEKKATYLNMKPYIRDRLDVDRPNWREMDGEATITIHVPLANVFDETAHEAILEHVEVETGLQLRERASLPPGSQRGLMRLTKSTHLVQPRIESCLHRPRLTDRLSEILEQRSVFLHADAGYGKTWLIQDFITTTSPSFIWYTFSSESVSAIQLVGDLASEVARQSGASGSRVLTYLQDRGREARPDEAVAIFCEEVGGLGGEFLLVIEDIHWVADGETQAVIAGLLESHPCNLRIILTSRLPLPFGQAKAVAQGILTVIDRSEIAFSCDETREYLETDLQLPLSSTQVSCLHDRTQGWVAAIALAGDVLRGVSPDDTDPILKRLTGFSGTVYDFFAEEVYIGLGEEIRWLLKRLGLVHPITPGLVDLFTGRTDGGQVLRDLGRRNTFLVGSQREGGYYLHSLFAEFLQTRFQDEEGSEAVGATHTAIAHYYAENHDWYPATRHAIAAREYQLAIEGLERIAPVGLNLGYGFAVLQMIEEVPPDWIDRSAYLQEAKGLAFLQGGDLRHSLSALGRAQEQYREMGDQVALGRVSFLVADVALENGDMSPEAFIELANRVALDCYQRNDVLLGSQVELRLIEVGQTLATRVDGLLKQLIERGQMLLSRLQPLGAESTIVRSRALAAQAHLVFQPITFEFLQAASKIHMRSSTGHPLPLEERVALGQGILRGLAQVEGLYSEAETVVGETSQIELAQVCVQHIRDNAHLASLSKLLGAVSDSEDQLAAAIVEFRSRERLQSCLQVLQRCAQTFVAYHMPHNLATTYCVCADIYDVLGDSESRNRYAQEAYNLAASKGLSKIAEQAQGILQDRGTLSSVLRGLGDRSDSGKSLADLDEQGIVQYVEFFLRGYAGDADVEAMREAATSDMEDMVGVARQEREWCRHVQIIQDLTHTRSLATMYRTIPKKWVVCLELRHRSPYSGRSFAELWPLFKGYFCLGCLRRSLTE